MNPAETLFHQIVDERQSFWTVVYTPFMSRDLTRETCAALVGLGLQHTSGSYRDLVELFHMTPADYKRFLNFLRKHQCHMPFQQFRGGATRQESASTTTRPRPSVRRSSPAAPGRSVGSRGSAVDSRSQQSQSTVAVDSPQVADSLHPNTGDRQANPALSSLTSSCPETGLTR